MANLQNKALNLASKTVTGASKLREGLAEVLDALRQKENSGVDFAIVDFSNTSLTHIDADMLNSVMTSALALDAWMNAGHHDDVFDKVRP